MDWERDLITRRSALARGFGGVFLVCSFDFDQRARPTGARTSAYARASQSAPFQPFQRDVPIPAVARPVARSRTLEQYVFTMRPRTADILPGFKTPVLGYDGLYPGPTIKATRGRAVDVRGRQGQVGGRWAAPCARSGSSGPISRPPTERPRATCRSESLRTSPETAQRRGGRRCSPPDRGRMCNDRKRARDVVVGFRHYSFVCLAQFQYVRATSLLTSRSHSTELATPMHRAQSRTPRLTVEKAF